MSDLTDVTRKLLAVFAADVEGYSRLMGADEVGTMKGLSERRAILDRFPSDRASDLRKRYPYREQDCRKLEEAFRMGGMPE